MWDGGRDEELEVAPLPGGSPVWLYGYFISTGTAHPEAAWRWLRFLSHEVGPPHRLPARQSLIPSSAYAAAVGEEALEVFRYAAEHALLSVRPVAVERLLRQAVERVFEGEGVEGALAEAQEQALALPTPGVAEPFTIPSSAPPESSVETITFVTFLHQGYVALAEAFHEVHPDIKVIVREARDFDYHGWRPAEMLKASGADCFRAGHLALTVPGLRQAVLSLQPFIDADPTFSLDDYIPWALERVRYEGDLWGLPAGVNVNVLWYNRMLFDEASLPYPEDDWSWDDVFLTAHRLAGGERGGQYYGFIIWPDARIAHLFEAIGGPLVDESPASPTFCFDAPEAVAAAQQLRSLVQEEVIPIPEQSKEEPGRNLYTLIWANRVGMWVEGAIGFQTGRNRVPKGFQAFDFRPVPLPQPSRCQSFWLSSAYYIAADTPHAEACWDWLRFLSERIPDTSALPPRYSLLTSDAFREQVGAEARAAYLEALECKDWATFYGLKSLPPYSEGALYTWLVEALGEILWHGADVQTTLSEAQQKAEAYLDCLRQHPHLKDWETAEACLQEVDAP
jgi:multiple sugar transport system substrate-binding protein